MSNISLVSVSIPRNILINVDKIVKKSGKYVSRADFCRTAVRELLNKEVLILEKEGIETSQEEATA